MSNENTPMGGWASGATGGPRPTDPHAQMAYDNAARLRQASTDHAKQQQKEWNQRNHQKTGTHGGSTAPTSDPFTLNDYLAMGSIGGFTVLLIVFWNGATAQLHPSNPILAGLVQHGVWAVGIGGLYIGIALKEYLMKIGKIIFILAALFFGTAFAYGLYQGFTGAS